MIYHISEVHGGWLPTSELKRGIKKKKKKKKNKRFCSWMLCVLGRVLVWFCIAYRLMLMWNFNLILIGCRGTVIQ